MIDFMNVQKPKRIYSLGCEGSKWEIIRNILQENKISLLIDIRRYNKTSGSSFNQRRLEKMCSDLDIEYIHESNLAPSKELIRYINRETAAIHEKYKILYLICKNQYQNNEDLMRDNIRDLREEKREELSAKRLEFVKRFRSEIASGNKTDLCRALIDRSDRPCFFGNEKYNHLNLSCRKVLLEQAIGPKETAIQIIHLREWFYHTGRVHDLRQIFDHVNEEYFEGKLKRSEVAFTWYRLQSGDSQFMFGFFRKPYEVYINAALDTEAVPVYFINAVFYHEMVHYIRYRDGLPSGHSVDFYRKELDFKDAGKAFHYRRGFFEQYLPEIRAELGLAAKAKEDGDEELEALFQKLEQILTGEANGNQ